MRIVTSFLFCLCLHAAFAQPIQYSSANAHAHNDYEQLQPFKLAHDKQFGSIETDVHLVGDQLLVGHDTAHLTSLRTIEYLYLDPLEACIRKNNGLVYMDSSRILQLMIDIKSDSLKTLETLLIRLKKYPTIINSPFVRIVITGNRPNARLFTSYPPFIWFDGRLEENYNPEAMSRVALFSNNFSNYVKWNGKGPISKGEKTTILGLVEKAHRLKKPIRFWATPDNLAGWEELIKMNVDFINTDRIAALADFLATRKK
jgi:alkaline phosphatase